VDLTPVRARTAARHAHALFVTHKGFEIPTHDAMNLRAPILAQLDRHRVPRPSADDVADVHTMTDIADRERRLAARADGLSAQDRVLVDHLLTRDEKKLLATLTRKHEVTYGHVVWER
jgi:hypothetical protein